MTISKNVGGNNVDDDLFDDLLNDDDNDEQIDVDVDFQPQDEDPEPTPLREDEVLNPMESFLKEKGIVDMNNIIFEDEEGNEITRSWGDLTSEEQLNILKQSDVDDDYGLENHEVAIINTIRESGLSGEEYINYIKQQAIQEFITANSNPEYSINEFTDDELYILDLKSKIPDITDEEASLALEHDKANESVFTKKITALRNEYIEYEQERIRLQQEEEEAVVAQEKAEFINNITYAIDNFKTIGNFDIELEDSDKQYINEIIAGEDKAGVRHIAKMLNDPATLVKMVWFATKGDEAFNDISKYYKAKISEINKQNKPKDTKTTSKTSTFARKPQPKPQPIMNGSFHFDDED